MEENPDVEFDYFLAEKLGRTVAELHASLTAREWLYWTVYYGRGAQRREIAARVEAWRR